jgi:hypothetical protein
MFPFIPANSASGTRTDNSQGIFGFGTPSTAVTNLVSNTGVVATDTKVYLVMDLMVVIIH